MTQPEQLQGTVTLLNIDTGIAAILIDNGEYSVVEMLDEIALALGDRISGALETLGETAVTNHTSGISGQVWIDDVFLDRETALLALARR
jgi:hypothetical protein